MVLLDCAFSEPGERTYQAVGTRRIVDPNPVGAIVSQPVLASVLIVTSGATHFDGLLPAGSKAF
jgi:hypothetical protein